MAQIDPSDDCRPASYPGQANARDWLAKLLRDAVPDVDASISLISEYLAVRQKQQVVGDGLFGVVLATTKYCNLVCKHCAVSAVQVNQPLAEDTAELSGRDLSAIVRKVAGYANRQGLMPFFMFGGGEPTLRTDFHDVVEDAAQVMGAKALGFCTNGTFRTPDEILKLAEHVALVEVSIDGFKEHHNKWRPPIGAVQDPYADSLELVKILTAHIPEKLEVASVVTKENLVTLPEFARFLRGIGVRSYSIHRPIPIGRMANQRDFVPNIKELFAFFAAMAEFALEDGGFSFHIHHSLESIYSALLLGRDIHLSDMPMGSRRHSIGIDWSGHVHFDPWSMVPPFSSLSPGNLLDDHVELEKFWSAKSSVLNIVSESKKANVRCYPCKLPCTGGMRLLAMIDAVSKTGPGDKIMPSQLMASLSAIDPACPMVLLQGSR
jgi:MoaA/NifB/PqqE/SkfB family radical SAM enzyme